MVHRYPIHEHLFKYNILYTIPLFTDHDFSQILLIRNFKYFMASRAINPENQDVIEGERKEENVREETAE